MLEENNNGLQRTSQETSIEVEENQHKDTENSVNEDNNVSNFLEKVNNQSNTAAGTIENKGFFIVKSANDWIEEAKNKPMPKKLFGEFWYEGELCIFFSDTNLGKSIKAVQIGNSISKGEVINGFELGAEKQKVIYFDFELSTKQFQIRYCDDSDCQNCYAFDDNFIRIGFNPNMELPPKTKFEDWLIQELERVVIETEAKIVIVDNITYLKEGTEKANDALPLMKELKALKHQYDLSILALAHTPKRDLSKPLTKNDLQGSKMLMNFCDSAFAIGESNLCDKV